jgi:serine/threonine protein kinase
MAGQQIAHFQVIFEMATRRRAFEGSTPGILLEALLTRRPPAPSLLNPALPPMFDQIVLKLLEKDRELRYQTAMDLRADLRRVRRDEDSTASRASSARLGVEQAVGKRKPALGARRARDGAKAAAEFERISARPGVEAVSPIHALA